MEVEGFRVEGSEDARVEVGTEVVGAVGVFVRL